MKDEAGLEALAERLRDRVAEGRYRAAQSALAEYCGALRKKAGSFAPGDPGLIRLQNEWMRLAEDTRRRVLAGRAHAGARLARLSQTPQRIRSYDQDPPARRTCEWLG
jgi:hypothetical protein